MESPPSPSPWFAASAAFASATAGAAGVALGHIWTTAQRGAICGLEQGTAAHCWACYATPLLALATFVTVMRGLEPKPQLSTVSSGPAAFRPRPPLL